MTLTAVSKREEGVGSSGAVPDPADGEASGELSANTRWMDRSTFSDETLAGVTGPWP